VSRQAVIKSFLRQGLDRHYLAGKKRMTLAHVPRKVGKV
jgi:hypothetical protein